MGRGERRKCKCCRKLFRRDPRNRRHQHSCSAPACIAASKAASQARWLARPENRNYFRGPVHVARVQAWRSRHRGIGARGEILILRYKMSQRRNSLVLLTKQTIWRARRCKNSCWPNPLF
jgi:hypothetical protein